VAVTVRQHERTPLWRNTTVLKWTAQLLLLGLVLAAGYALASQAGSNIEDRGITFGTRWLDDPPGISIREGIDLQPDSGRRAIYAGIVNTLRVAISGIIAATILGTIIGVARLSKNWIVNKVATVYIETIRNVPLLVQIFFWLAVVQSFRAVAEEDVGEYWFFTSSRGLSFPWLFPADGFYHWLAFLVVGGIAAYFVYRWRMRLKEERGAETYAVTWGNLTFLLFALVGWFIHPVVSWLGSIWSAIADVFGAIPTALLQIVLVAGAVGAAAWWIKRFLDTRRTAAGIGKLTDDDWFRMIFAGLVGLGFALLFLSRGAIAATILDGVEAFFDFLSQKYDSARTAAPLEFSRPAVEVRGTGGFVQLAQDSLVVTPGFFALWVGVTLYTASFIAEIVRGGILAVAKGQTEAAGALGLSRFQALRFIILPQAFRIILPPMGNQYLNLFKNTSLGIAVAYPEIVQVGQTLYNQTGQTIPVVLTWMGFYLTGSLVLSAIVNYYNRRLRLKER
jgi:general L-amino acid transport system permease protein